MLKNQAGKVWTSFVWLTLAPVAGSCGLGDDLRIAFWNSRLNSVIIFLAIWFMSYEGVMSL